MHFASRVTVDEVSTVHEPGIFVCAELADDSVFDNIELAGGQCIREQQVDGTGEAITAQGGAVL
jgi:hypothetical protein